MLGGALIPELQDVGAMRQVLPYGRYLVTLSEIKERFAPEEDGNRRAIWTAFYEQLEVARMVFGKVAGVWIGGSFITSETQPHDVDVVYLIQEDSYKKALDTNEGRFFVEILKNKRLLSDGTKPKVDAYFIAVPPTGTSDDEALYISTRGYWDQFLSKTRFLDDDERWRYPAAGYLQVVIDGYDN